MIGAHRDAVAIAAQYDQRLLDRLAVAIHHVIEQPLNGVALLLHLLPDRSQFRRSILAEFSVAREELVQLSDQLIELGDRFGNCFEARKTIDARERLAHCLRGANRAHDHP